jgi:hypothetical protein
MYHWTIHGYSSVLKEGLSQIKQNFSKPLYTAGKVDPSHMSSEPTLVMSFYLDYAPNLTLVFATWCSFSADLKNKRIYPEGSYGLFLTCG